MIKLIYNKVIIIISTSVIFMTRLFRYHDDNLNNLVIHLQQQSQSNQAKAIKIVKQDRKAHVSCMQMAQTCPRFNSNTKEGQVIDKDLHLLPYKFIPQFKNQTFIWPDRALARGSAARRFKIKMKDTSIASFKDEQDSHLKKILKKQQKQHTILSRKMQEFTRIIDRDNGRCRAAYLKLALDKKHFQPISASSNTFNKVEVMSCPTDSSSVLIKKINLSRTYQFNKWKPASKINSTFYETNASVFSKFSQNNISFR